MGQSSESEMARKQLALLDRHPAVGADGCRAREQDLFLERPARQVERSQCSVESQQIRRRSPAKARTARPASSRPARLPQMPPRPRLATTGPLAPAPRARRSSARPAAPRTCTAAVATDA